MVINVSLRFLLHDEFVVLHNNSRKITSEFLLDNPSSQLEGVTELLMLNHVSFSNDTV